MDAERDPAARRSMGMPMYARPEIYEQQPPYGQHQPPWFPPQQPGGHAPSGLAYEQHGEAHCPPHPQDYEVPIGPDAGSDAAPPPGYVPPQREFDYRQPQQFKPDAFSPAGGHHRSKPPGLSAMPQNLRPQGPIERVTNLSKRAKVILGSAAALILLAIVLAITLSSGPSGYNDPNTLFTAVEQYYQNALDSGTATAGGTITGGECVHQTGNQFSCVLQLSDGETYGYNVTVSSDGSNWVSNPAG